MPFDIDSVKEPETAMPTLRVDPARYRKLELGSLPFSHILVQAQHPSVGYVTTDLAALDKASLQAWLTSRGGSNPWAESHFLMLLGHAP